MISSDALIKPYLKKLPYVVSGKIKIFFKIFSCFLFLSLCFINKYYTCKTLPMIKSLIEYYRFIRMLLFRKSRKSKNQEQNTRTKFGICRSQTNNSWDERYFLKNKASRLDSCDQNLSCVHTVCH